MEHDETIHLGKGDAVIDFLGKGDAVVDAVILHTGDDAKVALLAQSLEGQGYDVAVVPCAPGARVRLVRGAGPTEVRAHGLMAE